MQKMRLKILRQVIYPLMLFIERLLKRCSHYYKVANVLLSGR